MSDKKPWPYSIQPCQTISVDGCFLTTIHRKNFTLKVEDSFEVDCINPETRELFELGTFETAEQAQTFADAHGEWRRHPKVMCTTCSASYPLVEPTPENVVAAVS